MSNADALSSQLMQRLPPSLAAAAAHLPALAVGAALLAWLWRLPIWWRVINLLFLPLLWLALQAEVDTRWYLAGFAALALTSLGAVRTRVPLYLSSPQAAQALARCVPANAVFMDLGCGLGGPLSRLSRLRPDIRLQGIEAAPLNWLIARLRLRGRAQVAFGSLWQSDLSACDVVYAYLSPAPMARLWAKARAEMRPGSLFISNTFPVPDVAPQETLELHDLSHARLLIWRLS